MTETSALEIIPCEKLQGEVTIPGSKSFTNRALVIAALAEGKSRLLKPLHSEDTRYMAGAWRTVGVPVDERERGNVFEVAGCGGRFSSRQAELFLGNSGTSIRFLLAALCLAEGRFRLDGNSRMQQRPSTDLIAGLRQLGCRVDSEKGNGCPPIVLQAHGLPGGTCRIPGDRSSQYFSALLMAAPYAHSPVVIQVEGELVSKPYVDMTIEIMEAFGASVENHQYQSFEVATNRTYTGREYSIEPDASNASYYWGAAAIGGGPVRVRGLSLSSSQGDVHFVDILARMGCNVRAGEDWIEVTGGELKGGEFDLGDMPDTAQTLAVVALFARGTTTIRNIGNLRIKETDRIAAVATELTKLGGVVEQGPDSLTITPAETYRGARIETYDDHRMAMSFALAGTRIPGVTILDPECTAKTYPGFFEEIARVGVQSKPER